MRTRVGIVGGGPAGLVLSHLLHPQGIESVVLELRSRHVVETTVRAGVLEHGTAELLRETGVGERMDREGAVHNGVNLQFGRRRHRIDFPELTEGRKIWIYGQQEVVKDLYATRLKAGGQISFEAAACAI
jgi:p-hydroxybenzoate 3-monooxygenase